eukprot:scaffold25686_cov72-Skeletonema_dohrnii-CCMP3373.AAC.1
MPMPLKLEIRDMFLYNNPTAFASEASFSSLAVSLLQSGPAPISIKTATSTQDFLHPSVACRGRGKHSQKKSRDFSNTTK